MPATAPAKIPAKRGPAKRNTPAEEEMITCSVILPAAMINEIKLRCDRDERSFSWLVRHLLANALNDQKAR